MTKTCLIIVDVQNDFCPNGALAVKDGDKIIPFINEIVKNGGYDFVITTQDYHTENHISFASKHGVEPFTEFEGNVVWPNHCVVDTDGVDFHKDLYLEVDANFIKGYDVDVDSYSGFGGILDTDGDVFGLEEWLKANSITDVDVVGLATDYCVKATAIDSAKLGFNTAVLDEGTMPVNDKEQAYEEMIEEGVSIMYSAENDEDDNEDTHMFSNMMISMTPFL